MNEPFPVKLGSDRRETLPKRVSNNFGRLIFRRQRNFFVENFGQNISFFADLTWILRSYGETDIKISFRAKFCSRYTYPEVCTTKNHDVDGFRVLKGGVVSMLTAAYSYCDSPLQLSTSTRRHVDASMRRRVDARRVDASTRPHINASTRRHVDA